MFGTLELLPLSDKLSPNITSEENELADAASDEQTRIELQSSFEINRMGSPFGIV